MKDLRYWIADKLFCKELDDAFDLGKRTGEVIVRNSARHIIAELEHKRKHMTKPQDQGYARALEIVRDEFELILEHKL